PVAHECRGAVRRRVSRVTLRHARRVADNADSPDQTAVSDDTTRASRAWTAAPLTAWAVTFVLLRLFAVSGYDWDTAFSVSTTLELDDAAALIFGSLMGAMSSSKCC